MADERDITNDFLLCNRCGACRAVCPVFEAYREEWSSARGKVELAEAYLSGVAIPDGEILKVFDLCLHCMTCEENCPSGMRADEIVLAVKADMVRRGFMPRLKAAALSMTRGMDAGVFRALRRLGLVRKEPFHGYGGASVFRYLFPVAGWSPERSVPLPAAKPFLGSNPEFFSASRLDGLFPDGKGAAAERRSGTEKDGAEGSPPEGRDRDKNPAAAEQSVSEKADALLGLVRRARDENIKKGTSVYFYIGHTVNHFFPEEAEALVWVLNLLGVDVHAPRDQECCGAPYFYSGDIENAREAAALATERIAGHKFDRLVTSCSSGGRMLKEEFPRLFDLSSDGFFEIGWDRESEVFVRKKGKSKTAERYREAGEMYKNGIDGKVVDINELLAELLGLKKKESGFEAIFGPGRGQEPLPADVVENGDPPSAGGGITIEPRGKLPLPIVTYHHPCHLNRGQGVDWQPEALLELLPAYRYVRMPDADRCCGGGGAFTFTHSKVSEMVAARKMDAVAAVSPDIVATSCPICRIQLMDMLRRRFVLEAGRAGGETRKIPVRTPVELLAEELRKVLQEGLPEAPGA